MARRAQHTPLAPRARSAPGTGRQTPRRRTACDERYRFDRFELNASSLELLRDGVPVRLRPQPARLLVHLVRHERTTFRRSELSELLWRDRFADADQGLNTCIREIRRALGDDADSPRFLQTLRGVGYRFIAPATPVSGRRLPPWMCWKSSLGIALALAFLLAFLALYAG